jgi:N-acetylneuraminate synthase
LDNFKYIHLNVLKTYQEMFPDQVLGLSDHTPGLSTVLGAVALGARVIEKHFTDDRTRQGPDHKFSMTPDAWREMVDRTRELELALGTGDKTICPNEIETAVIQRRCLRAARPIQKGEKITREMIEVLRPAPPQAIKPDQIGSVIGLHARENIPQGQALYWIDFS